jgi:predicted amidohydrolase YtcJ
MLLAMDGAGYTVKIHTAGDRSVRVALDALAAVREQNGDSGLRHELAHAGFIAESDIPRFKTLNVVADLSPYLWHPSPIIDSVVGAVGPRGEQYWPVRTLMQTDSPILVGSDWPAAVPSINPWPGIEAMVTRRNPYQNDEATLWAEESVPLADALKLFIADSAAAFRRSDIGCICEQNSADLAVLDQAIFDIAPENLGDTRAYMTLYKGRVVFKQD